MEEGILNDESGVAFGFAGTSFWILNGRECIVFENLRRSPETLGAEAEVRVSQHRSVSGGGGGVSILRAGFSDIGVFTIW